MVIGVVLLGFQHSAYADEKDKDKKKDQTTVTKTDTIKIKVNLDIHADDTLVFDDFDEDKDDKGDNGTIAAIKLPGSVRTCIIPALPMNTTVMACGVTTPVTEDDSSSDEESDNQTTEVSEPLNTSIYPNPASPMTQSIYVTHNLKTNAIIQVFTLSGQKITTISSSEQRVELPGLASGIYIVHIAGEHQSDSQRLLVQ